MFFFFKRKKVVLDCFNTMQQIVDLFPIEKSSKHFPDWWKQLPKSIDTDLNEPKATMKSCHGLIDFYSESFCIPLWADLSIKWKNNPETQLTEFCWHFSDDITKIVSHPVWQRGSFLNHKEYTHLKIENPWHFKCKEEIKFLCTQNTYTFDKPEKIIIVPGVLEFKYQPGANINFIIPYNNKIDDKILIESGSPIMSIFPLTDREIVIKNHCISLEEMDKIRQTGNMISFINKYGKIKKLYKGKEKKEKKCPFHFGK